MFFRGRVPVHLKLGRKLLLMQDCQCGEVSVGLATTCKVFWQNHFRVLSDPQRVTVQHIFS